MNMRFVFMPLFNMDNGATGGTDPGAGTDLGAGTDPGTTDPVDTGTPAGGQGSSASSVVDSLEIDGGVSFTPEQKQAIAKIISGRVNEIKKTSESFKQVVEMMGDIIGTKDINTITERLRQLHAQHQARQMGMTPQGFQQYQAQVQALQQQTQQALRAQVESEFDKLRSNPQFIDADLYRDEIIELAIKSGLPVSRAYWAVAGEQTVQKAKAAAASDAQHRTLNQVMNNQTKRVDGGDTGGQKSGPKVTPEIEAAARRIGMDPVEYMQYMNIRSIEEARALNKQGS